MSKQDDPGFEKLARLLALKRHERPPQPYFDNFLAEFHRRQRVEPIRARGWWEQFCEFFRGEPILVARYALGGALALLLCVNAFLLLNRSAQTPAAPPLAEIFTPQPPPSVFAAQVTSPGIVPSADVPTHSWAPQLASNVQSISRSQFILDRVQVSPASYDPRGDF